MCVQNFSPFAITTLSQFHIATFCFPITVDLLPFHEDILEDKLEIQRKNLYELVVP